jgi:hypothetical protein
MNKGAVGVDDIGIAEFKDHLKRHWTTIKVSLLAGESIPQPVYSHSAVDEGGTEGGAGLPLGLQPAGPWRKRGTSARNRAFPKSFFDCLGLVSLLDTAQRLQGLS